MTYDNVKEAFGLLDKWIEKNGWAGWDPYDLKAQGWVLRLSEKGSRNFFFHIYREFVFEFFNHFPGLCRRWYKIKPQVNAKAMGLFASSYLDLFQDSGEVGYREKAEQCLTWLSKNKAKNVTGSGWGYPFDWFSNQLIPAGTPNGIVTTVVGDAYWKASLLLKKDLYLNECINIAHFLALLPKHEIRGDQLCFSYTPLYVNHVHNLNLFVAEFLLRIGRKVNNQGWIDLGNKAVNYTLSCQHEDGSFDYNGPPEKPANFIDHYHSGFVLRMLHAVWKMTGRRDVYHSLEKGYRYYIANFFYQQKIPKLLPWRTYRIDIHSCAEAVLCLGTLEETFPGSHTLARNILYWTIQHLQSGKGYFYYGILKSRFTGIIFTSRIPYIRWGQAWMHRAMSLWLRNHKE